MKQVFNNLLQDDVTLNIFGAAVNNIERPFDKSASLGSDLSCKLHPQNAS